MDGNMRNAEVDVEFTRIKAIRPQIIVTGTVDKPYYEILYYDTSDNVWHIGYSSYNLANVIKWKEECFEVVGEIEDMQPTADVEEVKHSRWENISGFDVCNICGTSPAYCEPKPNNPKGYPPYCPYCGAIMDGERRDT